MFGIKNLSFWILNNRPQNNLKPKWNSIRSFWFCVLRRIVFSRGENARLEDATSAQLFLQKKWELSNNKRFAETILNLDAAEKWFCLQFNAIFDPWIHCNSPVTRVLSVDNSYFSSNLGTFHNVPSGKVYSVKCKIF